MFFDAVDEVFSVNAETLEEASEDQPIASKSVHHSSTILHYNSTILPYTFARYNCLVYNILSESISGP